MIDTNKQKQQCVRSSFHCMSVASEQVSNKKSDWCVRKWRCHFSGTTRRL